MDLSAVGDDHTQQPRSAVGAFHPTETAQTTLAAHIVIFLAGKQVKATAIGSKVSVGLGSIEVGVSGQRTYAQVPAEVRAAVEAFLAEHPEPHVAAWAGKAGAVEVE